MANLFLRRNIVFERLRLLARIFSKERIELMLQLLEQEMFKLLIPNHARRDSGNG